MVSQLTNSKWQAPNLFLQLGYANWLSSCSYKTSADVSSKFNCRKPASGIKFTYSVLILLVAVGVLIKCVEGKVLLVGSNTKLDSDCEEFSCFCDNVFFRRCPPRGYCKIRRLPSPDDRMPALSLSSANNMFGLDCLEPGESYYPMLKSDLVPTGSSELDANGKVVMLRHVRVDNPDSLDDVLIHPVRVKIPIKVNEMLAVMPPVKHKYKMHEYTTQETKLKTEMVPVTETVIKPIGISKDQIVGNVTP